MPAPEVNILWIVLTGTAVFFTLAGTIVVVFILGQRRRLRDQARMVEKLQGEIRERERVQEELKASEKRYRSLVENINRMYCILDGAFTVVYASPNMSETLGVAENDLLGKLFTTFIDRRDRKRVAEFYNDCIQRGVVDTSSTFRLSVKGGGAIWVEQSTRIKRDEMGKVMEFRSVLSDVTERRRAEGAIRTLSHKIVMAQEAERRRVARELHDGIVQLLSSIRFRLQGAGPGQPKERERTAAKEAVGLLDDAIQEVRRISHHLRPSALDDLGLAPALRTLCEEFTEKTKIGVDLHVPENPKQLSETVELTLFRVIQEALNNVQKHSGASQVTVHVEENGNFVQARIEDNGHGFGASLQGKAGRRIGGMGLEGMKERVQFLGGSIDVSSKPQHGVQICLRLPRKERDGVEL